jgi:hypothetical protein
MVATYLGIKPVVEEKQLTQEQHAERLLDELGALAMAGGSS